MSISHQQAIRIAEEILQGGGATFNDKGAVSFLGGYQVAFKGHGWVTNIDQEASRDDQLVAIASTVLDFYEVFEEDVSLRDNWYCGGWINGGQLFLDMSAHFVDRDHAEIVARDNDQLAIYDWKNECDITVELEPSWTMVTA